MHDTPHSGTMIYAVTLRNSSVSDPYHTRYGRVVLPHNAEVPIGPMHELIGESSSVDRGAVVARPGSISPTVRSNFQSFVTAVGASLTVIAVRGARAVDIH